MIKRSVKKKSIPKKLLLWFKIFITSSLCVYIILKADWQFVQFAIQNANVLLILIIFLGMLIDIALSALKWQTLLNIHGIYYSLGTLTKYYLIGVFFGNFLPGTIGGDGYRIYKTLNNPRSRSGAVISIFTERIFGLMILLGLGLCASVGSFLKRGDNISLFGIIFSTFGLLVFIIFVSLLFREQTRSWVFKKKYIPQKIKSLVKHVDDYRRQPRAFIKFIGISFLFYILLFFCRLLLIYAVGESCPVFSFVMVVMMSTVLAAIPISLNGIGILDGSFIYLISKFGVTYESALMVMVLYRLLTLLLSLIGGIFYFFDNDQKNKFMPVKSLFKN